MCIVRLPQFVSLSSVVGPGENCCKAQLEITTKFAESHTLDFFTKFARAYEGHRFDLRFLRPFRADLSIKKSSTDSLPLPS
jgi:hypothetical protein